MPARHSVPSPLPQGLLARLSRKPGILLCLDYDGTLAELVPDPDQAWPIPGVCQTIDRIARASANIEIAIVTGRTIASVQRLIPVSGPVAWCGLHGLEFVDPVSGPLIIPEVERCAEELEAVRGWLRANVPQERGFWIEDKRVAVGLHYRLADPDEARRLCHEFEEFVAAHAPLLKVVRLKMLAEAMPCVASKSRAIVWLKAHAPAGYSVVYCGDDLTDEDAFAALGPDDVGILVGQERSSHARYRVAGPHALARELIDLAAAVTDTPPSVE